MVTKPMRKWLKRVGLAAAVLVVVAGAGLTWLAARSPAMRPASTETIERTPARVARGEYLVRHLSVCLDCHSDHLGDRFGFPVKPGTEGQGGFPFDEKMGVPGLVCAQNITPDPDTGIGRWSDGEVMRAIREGVDRDGNALFPMMPYAYYHAMSDEDARAVVAYLRTLPPIKNAVPARRIAFPVNLLIKSAPQPLAAPIATPDDRTDHLGYGRYLVTVGACRECHTAHDAHGQLLPGRDFAGGWLMQAPGLRVVSANITPSPDTFMGTATREQFIGRIRSFAGQEGAAAPVAPPGRNTLMPWAQLAGLTDGDLTAIYDYLKTVPPVQNTVDPFPDAARAP